MAAFLLRFTTQHLNKILKFKKTYFKHTVINPINVNRDLYKYNRVGLHMHTVHV